ncbi:MAG: protein-disulfide reductase DsbD N-terminal domain-containing protein [Gemmataceae bacterium]
MTAVQPKRLVILGLGLLLLGLAATGRADQDRRSSAVAHVRATASKIAPDGTQTLTFTLTIDPGWHLYANPVRNEDLSSVQTTLRMVGPVEALSIAYPPGDEDQDPAVGSFRVYEKETMIRATFRRSRPDVPVEAHLRFQACSKSTCLQPSTVMVKLPAVP